VAPHDRGIIESVNAVALNETAVYLGKDLERVVILPPSVDGAYLRVLEENVVNRKAIETSPPRVVFTPIHGTGGVISVPLMERLGVEVVTVEEQAVMDPRFPTVKSPNPENAEALAMAVTKATETDADLLIGTDPDGDRMGVGVRNAEGGIDLLSGNTTGSLLAEFRIEQLKEAGWIPAEGTDRAALVKTFVTTPLQAAIARHHGLKLIDTLTGFKFVGEKLHDWEEELVHGLLEEEGIALDYDHTEPRKRAELLQKYSTFYVFGGEESYGYLASDRVRDKDANAAIILFCELAASLKAKGSTIAEYRDALFLRYGYFHETLLNLLYEGASGAERIGRILESYRKAAPSSMGGHAVTRFTDFGVEEVRDADGKRIPKQDFFVLELANGYSYAVRGSGTEPKIKFYLFGHEAVPAADALASIKATTTDSLNALRDAIETDARQRAGEGGSG
jgi:phosphoglucomutase